jgi:hypothetical protein
MPELLEPPIPGKWKTVLTDSDLAVELANSLKNKRRPVAIHAYGTGASRRYLLSWVKNSGADFQDWGWTKGWTPDKLSQEVDGAHDRLRLFLVEPIVEMKKLAAVWFIRDMSSSAPWLTWNWRPEISAGQLKKAVPAGHRLTCVRALETGASKVAAIWTQDDSGAKWDWNPSLTADELHVILRDTKSRLVTLDNHGGGSKLRYCAAWVDNTAESRTWFWFTGAKETYLRGQSDGLCSHPVELCNLGRGNLAAILNRTPAPGTPADDVLLEVTGMSTVEAFNSNDEATNTQMDLDEKVTVQVTNVAGADVEIVTAAMRWASSGGQSDALAMSPPDPTGGAATIPAGGTVGPANPLTLGSGIEYRDIVAYIDAKTADGRRQRLLRPLTVQRPGFDAHVVPALGEPVALAMWTDVAEVVPMWRGGKETRWITVGGTIVNLTGDDLSIVRMDVEVVVDGAWLLEANLSPLRFHRSLWPDERGCQELNDQDGCSFVEAESNGTLELGKKVLSRFVHGFEIDADPGFDAGNLRLILHYQRRRRCGTVLRDLPMRWTEPVSVSPPVRGGTFHWGSSCDHSGFDAHSWPGQRTSLDISVVDGPDKVYPMAHGFVVQVAEPEATPNDPNPNQWITVWHPDLELWTGYYHLKPGTLVPKTQGEEVFPDQSIAQIGNSGTTDPHLHTGGHIFDTTGLCRLTPLRFAGLTDDQDHVATQTPATGSYKS